MTQVGDPPRQVDSTTESTAAAVPRRVDRIDVSEHFSVSPSRKLLLPLVPAIVAFILASWRSKTRAIPKSPTLAKVPDNNMFAGFTSR